MFSICSPLIISPVIFPPLSSPIPHPLISVSVYLSLFVPHVLCNVSLLLLLCVCVMKSLCFLACLLSHGGVLLNFDFCYFSMFDLNFATLFSCFICYFVFWSLDSFSFVLLVCVDLGGGRIMHDFCSTLS